MHNPDDHTTSLIQHTGETDIEEEEEEVVLGAGHSPAQVRNSRLQARNSLSPLTAGSGSGRRDNVDTFVEHVEPVWFAKMAVTRPKLVMFLSMIFPVSAGVGVDKRSSHLPKIGNRLTECNGESPLPACIVFLSPSLSLTHTHRLCPNAQTGGCRDRVSHIPSRN
eukprot:GFYU01038307.1.p1 GENE.GFYU01038307.1~~GFYU01038307.1.p1  ORF type:complete len:165 (+),score=7.96 GFYU01038307.1:249-743(+)